QREGDQIVEVDALISKQGGLIRLVLRSEPVGVGRAESVADRPPDLTAPTPVDLDDVEGVRLSVRDGPGNLVRAKGLGLRDALLHLGRRLAGRGARDAERAQRGADAHPGIVLVADAEAPVEAKRPAVLAE